MDKHFTVTIHDENGVKTYNIHKMMKKLFVYLLMLFVIIGVVAFGTIFYLNQNVEKIHNKKEKIEKAYNSLRAKDMSLQESMLKTNALLEAKKEQLSDLSDSLVEIEEIMGLKPLPKENLQERVNTTKLTSKQRATLLELIPSGSPVPYHGITSKFGIRIHPITGKKEFHKGSDMKAKINTPVYATANGIVEWAGFHKRSGFGNLIILAHAYGFKSYFGHLKKVVIKSGGFVKKGDLIGYTGSSGMSNGPHLHYEIRFLQRPLNPFWFIKWTQQNYNQIFEKEQKVPWQSIISAITQLQLVNNK